MHAVGGDREMMGTRRLPVTIVGRCRQIWLDPGAKRSLWGARLC
jgi:hypothetical protein